MDGVGESACVRLFITNSMQFSHITVYLLVQTATTKSVSTSNSQRPSVCPALEEIIIMTKIINSRRNFVKLTAAGAVGGAISWDAASYARVLGSNDRISVGVV